MTGDGRSLACAAVELVVVAAAVGLVFAVEKFLVKPFKIPSASMEPSSAAICNFPGISGFLEVTTS